MNLLPFEGYMIPGLHFKDCSVWILNWENNPTPYRKMIEVWILWYDGRKECYIAPGEAEQVLRKYHHFDHVISSDISVTLNEKGIDVAIALQGENICSIRLRFKRSIKYGLINLLLKMGNKDKIGEKGKTETGQFYHNVPSKIIPLRIKSATLNGVQLQLIDKPQFKFSLGDGKPADEPIVNFCTHLLEE